jgi:GT2 family glycosyltransferase
MTSAEMSTSTRQRITAAVISHERADRALRCLAALSAQTVAPDEILVVDSGSRDGTPERLRAARPDVRVIALPANDGPGAARNRALAEATGELVLMIDDDIYPDPDCLEQLLRAKEAQPAEILVPRILLEPERHIVQCEGGAPHVMGTLVLTNGFTPLSEIHSDAARYQNATPSGVLLVERDPVRAAGGFDESYFFYLEDLEMSLRARILGLRILSVPRAVVRHDRGTGTALAFRGEGPYPRERAYLLMRNRLRTIATHFAGRTLLGLAPALLLYEFATLLFALARGWGGAWLDAWRWMFLHRHEIVRKRRSIQERRRVPDRELLVGGPLPAAPGLLGSRAHKALFDLLGAFLSGWWGLVRPVV